VHDAVLAYLDEDGTRASALAERAQLSRQAITQIVDELEALGVVRRRPDPDDGRAKIVEYTPEALEVYRASRQAMAEIEKRWAAQLGRRRYEALRSGLEEIAQAARPLPR
jgi:DNA-binding MarR family transcriptional regulator